MRTRIPASHGALTTTHTQGTLSRFPSPWFAPPVPSGMREPGANWYTIITAKPGTVVQKPSVAARTK